VAAAAREHAVAFERRALVHLDPDAGRALHDVEELAERDEDQVSTTVAMCTTARKS